MTTVGALQDSGSLMTDGEGVDVGRYDHPLSAAIAPGRRLISRQIDAAALNQLSLPARTHNKWQPKDVPDTLLEEPVNIRKLGPTSANCSPARILFVKSQAAKERLKPYQSEGNREKAMAALVTALIGYDLKFCDQLPKLFPHNKAARSWFTDGDEDARTTAFRNGSFQGAYFILAARALPLDTGPMSGFNNAGVEQEFFAGAKIRSNFRCSLGYGEPAGVLPRSARLSCDETAKII
jgi:3-hydroxypropanoate dehydrogenase